jgi:molecular chaperone DnaK
LKNEADQFVYNTEKQLTEHSAKIPQNIKDQVRGDISAVNEAIVAENADKIAEALEKLKNTSMEIGKSIYSQANDDANSEAESQQSQPEEEEKTEEEKKKEEEEKNAK